jgi:4,5-DOPA dioxygenase extradiol
MDRRTFLAMIGSSMAATPLLSADWLLETFSENGEVMPALFVGHGSPMNGIEDNEFSRYWRQLAGEIPKPSAVLCISAHWLTRGTYITAMDEPRTIHDFGGFPPELFAVQYPAKGHPELATMTANLISSTNIGLDHEWGLDHGTWTVVRHMYPDASVPVLQLSIDATQPISYHYLLAKELMQLRRKGVLIIGSGNMVHNLGMVAWDRLNERFGFDWAIEMNELFKQKIVDFDHEALIAYEKLGSAAKLAVPTTEHYLPLIYTLGLRLPQDNLSFFNDQAVAGSLTMTSVRFG